MKHAAIITPSSFLAKIVSLGLPPSLPACRAELGRGNGIRRLSPSSTECACAARREAISDFSHGESEEGRKEFRILEKIPIAAINLWISSLPLSPSFSLSHTFWPLKILKLSPPASRHARAGDFDDDELSFRRPTDNPSSLVSQLWKWRFMSF